MSATILMTSLEKLELRLLLEACYPPEIAGSWEHPFSLYAFAEAEHGSEVTEELMRNYGYC